MDAKRVGSVCRKKPTFCNELLMAIGRTFNKSDYDLIQYSVGKDNYQPIVCDKGISQHTSDAIAQWIECLLRDGEIPDSGLTMPSFHFVYEP